MSRWLPMLVKAGGSGDEEMRHSVVENAGTRRCCWMEEPEERFGEEQEESKMSSDYLRYRVCYEEDDDMEEDWR
ncbi:hypothetical protein LINGRAHAP2_LOCUS25136 [Linum grandiflorum]